MNIKERDVLLGSRIRFFRTKMNLSQSEFAKAIGRSQSMTALIESGETNPSLNTLWAISDALKIEMSVLFQKELLVSI